MAELNATILDRVRLNASNDYQQRIPLAAVDGVDAVQKALSEPYNGRFYNEFQDGLVTVLGQQRANQLNWGNPLSKFKGDHFLDGKSFQDYAVGLVSAQQYDQFDTAAILRQNKVDIHSAFYSVNRRVVYPITVNESMLRQSFLREGGLNDFINMVLQAPVTSDEYDEYNFMLQTFAGANQRTPFYNIQSTIADESNPTDQEIKTLSRRIRSTVMEMGVSPNGLYNGFGVPTVSAPGDLVMITTPGILAAMQVNVLADAFNKTEVEFKQEMIVVNQLPWAGVHAIVVDRKAVIAGDSLYTIEGFRNAGTLTSNYFLHHHGGYAISPMHNIAVFSNTADSQVGVIDFELTGIDAALAVNGEAVTTAKRGSLVDVVVTATGDVDPDNELFRVPNNWTWSIASGVDADGHVSPRTFIDSNGRLHVGRDLEVGAVLTITVTSAYLNPSAVIGAPTVTVSDTVTLTVG